MVLICKTLSLLLVPSVIEICPAVLEKMIFKFSLLHNYLALEKSVVHHLNPFIQGCFVPSLVEIGPAVLEKKILNFCQCIFAIS